MSGGGGLAGEGEPWARRMAEGTAKGKPRSALDTIVAAIAEANNCIVVTAKEKDFSDIEIVDPLPAQT